MPSFTGEAIKGDPRALLGVSERPSRAEVETAHRRLAAVFSESRWRDDPELCREAHAWMQALDEAKATLLGSRTGPGVRW